MGSISYEGSIAIVIPRVLGPSSSVGTRQQYNLEGRGCTGGIVLVLARIELIFFLVAGIVRCFGFSRKIMLITH